jgi:hypothetical protein
MVVKLLLDMVVQCGTITNGTLPFIIFRGLGILTASDNHTPTLYPPQTNLGPVMIEHN